MAADLEQTSERCGQGDVPDAYLRPGLSPRDPRRPDPEHGGPRDLPSPSAHSVNPIPASGGGRPSSDPRAALTCIFRGALRGASPPQKGVCRRPLPGSGQGEGFPPTDPYADDCTAATYIQFAIRTGTLSDGRTASSRNQGKAGVVEDPFSVARDARRPLMTIDGISVCPSAMTVTRT